MRWHGLHRLGGMLSCLERDRQLFVLNPGAAADHLSLTHTGKSIVPGAPYT